MILTLNQMLIADLSNSKIQNHKKNYVDYIIIINENNDMRLDTVYSCVCVCVYRKDI